MIDESPSQPPSAEPAVRPLHDVWLKPRRVFRELAGKPVDIVDYLLGAAQGAVSWLALSRAQGLGATSGVAEIFTKALVVGSVFGVASLFLFAAIYARLGARAGNSTVGRAATTRNQVFHVLAYGGVPIAASLVIWLITALLAGETTFLETPKPDTEGFVVLLLRVQFAAHALLLCWSLVLQVMGFSEIQGITTRRALGIWLLGQLLAALAMALVVILVAGLLPLSPTS